MEVPHTSQARLGAQTVIDITARRGRPAARNSESPSCCASSLEQVESAWRLVYDRYLHMGLIDENPFGIHAVPSGMGRHACVIWGSEGQEVGMHAVPCRRERRG